MQQTAPSCKKWLLGVNGQRTPRFRPAQVIEQEMAMSGAQQVHSTLSICSAGGTICRFYARLLNHHHCHQWTVQQFRKLRLTLRGAQTPEMAAYHHDLVWLSYVRNHFLHHQELCPRKRKGSAARTRTTAWGVECPHPPRRNKTCDEAGSSEHRQPIERRWSSHKIEMRQHRPSGTD
jgi:hypothetical protein